MFNQKQKDVVASYVSWRHNTKKKWSDGGKRETVHLTYFNILSNRHIYPATLCGTRIPVYSHMTGEGLVPNWKDWSMIPDGPTSVCKRCERKQDELLDEARNPPV